PAVPAAAHVPAHDLPPGRAHPVRPVGAQGPRPGWARAAAPGLGRDRGGVLVAGDRRQPDLFQGGAGYFVGSRPLPGVVVLPEKLVWDREAAIAGGGRPTVEFAAFCGQLEVGWIILDAGD